MKQEQVIEKYYLIQQLTEMKLALSQGMNTDYFVQLVGKKRALFEVTKEDKFFKDKKLSQQIYSQLKVIDSLLCAFSELTKKIEDCLELLDCVQESESDILSELLVEVQNIQKEFDECQVKFFMRGEYDYNNAIVEINAGAGGDDAQDWVVMLYRMYKLFCNDFGFSVKELDLNSSEGKGLKSVSFLVNGNLAYGFLKVEKGVHRLVRISPFDSNARRHTSFASVEVMPEIDSEQTVNIKSEDIKVETFRSGGAGGQHVNKTDSAVRITHLKTNIVVSCQNERSQIQNRETAMSMLRSKLIEKNEREKQEKNREIKGDLKKIEWGSQIRSYVFAPYTLVKDHRTGYENSDVQSVMNGNLYEFIKEYLKKSN
ncbi:MAG: peptide chain release factor 2 [Clostridiales bacterium]|jgi:peptide chain release factor 2|nr:peptide chain release factor 2 [Clostridiales bacterium]